MINGTNQNAWYLKKRLQAQMELHTSVTVCSTKTCARSQKTANQHRDGKSAKIRTLWLSTWLVLRCQPFLKHSETFCFPCLPFLIASLLSKQKAIFLSAMNHLCGSVSPLQIINWSLGQKCPLVAMYDPNVNMTAPILVHYPLGNCPHTG